MKRKKRKFRIRIDPLDAKMSIYIRRRDGWKCRRCFKQFQPPTNGLHNAHCFTRGAKSTRFDLLNCMALCFGCHQHLDSHPEEKYAFWKKQIGDKAFDHLRYRAHMPSKPDYKLIDLMLDRLIKELDDAEKIC